jgi:ArsR family transcriptional regulator
MFCGEILAKHSISAPNLSHHLKVMTEQRLITSRKDGLNVFYRVIPETFAEYLKYLTRLASKPKR